MSYRRHRPVIVALALATLFVPPAAADDNKDCSHGFKDRDGRVAACTRLIDSRALSGSGLARVYAVRGFAFYIGSDYDRAAADLTEAIRFNPKSDEYRIDRGKVYDRREDYDRAIADFSAAIRINPSNYSPYVSRGLIYYFNKKDDVRAIADLTEALRLNSRSSPSMLMRGRAFERSGDLESALADFRNALSLDPKYDSAIEGIARVTKAMAARGSPAAPPAPAAAPPPQVAAVSEADRAGCQSTDGPRPDAIAACTRLMASKTMAGSELAVVYLWRGMHRSLESNHKVAMQDYNAALKLDPKLASGYLFRASSLEFQGDLKRALADYRMAGSLDPTMKDAADGAQRVELQLKTAVR